MPRFSHWRCKPLSYLLFFNGCTPPWLLRALPPLVAAPPVVSRTVGKISKELVATAVQPTCLFLPLWDRHFVPPSPVLLSLLVGGCFALYCPLQAVWWNSNTGHCLKLLCLSMSTMQGYVSIGSQDARYLADSVNTSTFGLNSESNRALSSLRRVSWLCHRRSSDVTAIPLANPSNFVVTFEY